MKLLHEGEVVGKITTNRNLTLEECFEILGIDINEEEGGISVWDYEKFEMDYTDDEVYEVTGQDGTVWEIRYADSVPCECRKKGTEEWEECNWGIFCEQEGIALDALA